MAFTEVERSICNKMSFDSSGLLNPAEAIKGAVKNQISGINSQLASYIPSSQATIDAASTTLENNVGSVIPGDSESDIEAMISLINKCAYLSDDEKLNNPIALSNAMTKSLFDKFEDYFGGVASVPEYALAQALSALEELYTNLFPRSSALTDLLKKADKLINCLSAVCNGEQTSKVIALTNQTQNLYNDFDMVGNPLDANYGKLDKDKLFTDAGLSPAEISKVTNANDEVDAIKAEGKKSIEDLMNATKLLKKAGVF
ncbi:MAG: hypothetical protein ACTSX1_09350 [Candidatus Heimdallarchaeaceae archaeon]